MICLFTFASFCLPSSAAYVRRVLTQTRRKVASVSASPSLCKGGHMACLSQHSLLSTEVLCDVLLSTEVLRDALLSMEVLRDALLSTEV